MPLTAESRCETWFSWCKSSETVPISSELVMSMQKKKEKKIETVIVIKCSVIVACNVQIQEQSMS